MMDLWVKTMAVPEPGMVEVVQPQGQTDTWTSLDDPTKDWLCAWCLHPVASDKDRFCYQGKSEFSFQNPARAWFNLLLFSRTPGCEEAGTPTLADTWFRDHAWSYSLCEGCRMHLGWHYSGPTEFTGLIQERIVRAVIRN